MFTRLLAAGMVAASAMSVSILAAAADELKIVNKSEYDIHELYVSSTKSRKWGPDQLGKDVTIDAGETFTLKDIPAGRYDLKVVDEDGTECELENVNFATAKVWTVTSKMLERCDAFGN